ncbi:MAG TPA: SRPBCC family protein [Intrasporangium sp.]|nr:SRPBCC family protein [Intrasporangium sp.]
MPSVQRSVVIARPVDEVFGYFADPMTGTEWRTALAEVSAEGPVAVGTIFRQRVSGPGGRTVPADIRMTALEPGRRVAFVGVAGPLRPEVAYDFEPVEGGTKVTFSLSAALSGPKKLFLGPIVQKSMEAEVAGLDTAKRILEGRPPPHG